MSIQLPRLDEKTDLNNYPHIDTAGRQFVKEVEFQMFSNPQWRNSERLWWGALRNEFLATIIGYEEAIHAAYMKGVQATQESLFESNGKDSDGEI